MVFFDPVVYPCDICHERRQEQYLTLQTENVGIGPAGHGMGRQLSVRYCRDKEDCVKGSMALLKRKIEAELKRRGKDVRRKR